MKLLSVTRSQDRPLEAGPALNRATATNSAIMSGAAGGNWGKKVPILSSLRKHSRLVISQRGLSAEKGMDKG
ncbi:hypothetical protein V496_08098 [Pseudogymnoascus sp. VKM F-4515 (FW-2607)]|nr:hypothetical protein V496_08098 [Pseudogymnoascus sp. VKM F-4515 (FW-2607)]